MYDVMPYMQFLLDFKKPMLKHWFRIVEQKIKPTILCFLFQTRCLACEDMN